MQAGAAHFGVPRPLCIAPPSPTAPAHCDSYVERVVWDGDDILYERREGGSQHTNGTIGYVHGGVIDQPLALMDGRILIPNWRGLYESAVNLDGTRVDCQLPGTTPCINVDWPAGQGVYYLRMGGSSPSDPSYWIGNLASNGEGDDGAAVPAEPVLRPGDGAVHAAGPDRGGGGGSTSTGMRAGIRSTTRTRLG